MSDPILPLPEDDETLIFRDDARLYGGPAAATLAKWASRPSEAPIVLPYTVLGRKAAYRAGDLRRLREVMTFKHAAQRNAMRAQRAAAAA